MSDQSETGEHETLSDSKRSFQFGLSDLLQLVTVSAVWCSVGVVGNDLTKGVLYVLGAATITWVLGSKWATGLNDLACRRFCAAIAAIVVVGAAASNFLFADISHFPIATYFVAIVFLLPWNVGPIAGVSVTIILILMAYLAFKTIFATWDRLADFSYSAAPDQGPLASSFTLGTLLSTAPLLIALLLQRGFLVRGRGLHLPIHLYCHVGMLIAAFLLIVYLNTTCRSSIERPSATAKLLVWGYFCLYAIASMVVLFPANFVIP